VCVCVTGIVRKDCVIVRDASPVIFLYSFTVKNVMPHGSRSHRDDRSRSKRGSARRRFSPRRYRAANESSRRATLPIEFNPVPQPDLSLNGTSYMVFQCTTPESIMTRNVSTDPTRPCNSVWGGTRKPVRTFYVLMRPGGQERCTLRTNEWEALRDARGDARDVDLGYFLRMVRFHPLLTPTQSMHEIYTQYIVPFRKESFQLYGERFKIDDTKRHSKTLPQLLRGRNVIKVAGKNDIQNSFLMKQYQNIETNLVNALIKDGVEKLAVVWDGDNLEETESRYSPYSSLIKQLAMKGVLVVAVKDPDPNGYSPAFVKGWANLGANSIYFVKTSGQGMKEKLNDTLSQQVLNVYSNLTQYRTKPNGELTTGYKQLLEHRRRAVEVTEDFCGTGITYIRLVPFMTPEQSTEHVREKAQREKGLKSFVNDQKNIGNPSNGKLQQSLKEAIATPQRVQAWSERNRLLNAEKYVNIVNPFDWVGGCCIDCKRATAVEKEIFIKDSERNSKNFDDLKLKATTFEFPVWLFSAQNFDRCEPQMGDVIFPNHCIHVHTHPMWDWSVKNKKIVQFQLPPGTELFMYQNHHAFGFFAAIAFIKSFKVSEIVDDVHIVGSDVTVHNDVFTNSTNIQRYNTVRAEDVISTYVM